MSNNLASYFTNTNTETSDLAGRSFFDLISECKDFNDREKNVTEDDSYYDIWPNVTTPDNLNNINEREFLFAIEEPLNDPVKQLTFKYFGTQDMNNRLLPNADSVIADVNGLQILIKCGCYRSVVNLTYKILRNMRPKQQINNSIKSIFTPYTFQIWFIRLSIMMKLKLYKEAEFELKQFENFEKPEYFYEYHQDSYPNRNGSMISFGLRVLNAELPQFLGRVDESINSLTKLLDTVDNIIKKLPDKENVKKLWHQRKHKIQFSLSNILINKKNYEKAIKILETIAESSYADKCIIWSTVGKIFIQIGNIKEAGNSFLKAKNFSKPDSVEDQCRNLLNLGLIKISNGLYKDALDYLKEANNLIPNNSMIINNIAFCLFYSGNLRDAISFIEKHINADPRKNLNESLIFNLCTLYELESSKAHQKKINLLLYINSYAGDGFNETCIQLQ